MLEPRNDGRMTLRDAIRILGTTATVTGTSDTELVAQVAGVQRDLVGASQETPTKVGLSVAPGLDGPLFLRPISAMLELARGTALQEDPEISAVARRWAVLRYLGVFARDSTSGGLRLDGTALQFIGPNQRRVLSEELGIGFGIVAAKHWCRTRIPSIGPIAAIDVDRSLHDGSVPNLHRNGNRQPDYLISYPDPANPRQAVFELLETKGTVTQGNAKRQLGRAVTQLAGLTISGRPVTGLAISTVSNRSGVTIMAVDPEEEPIRWALDQDRLNEARNSQSRERKSDLRLDISADELFAHATNVDRAALAEFSGLHTTASRWLPHIAERRSARTNSNTTRRTDVGQFVGTEFVVDLPGEGQRLRLFQGVERQIAEELNSVDAIAVAEAQIAFARRDLEASTDLAAHSEAANFGAALAFSSEGAMLELKVE